MKLDLKRLPDVTEWSRRQVDKLTTGRLIFGAGLAVVVMALAAQGDQTAEALESRVVKLPITGPVDHVLSGDAIRVGGQPVQLWGIAAPPRQSSQGDKAESYLRALIASHSLMCLDTGKRAYDRIVARCLDPWSRDIGELMVRAGWAHELPEFSGGHYAEAAAEADRLGNGLHSRLTYSPAPVDLAVDQLRATPEAGPHSGSHIVPPLIVGAGR